MRDEQEDKMSPASWQRPSILAFGLAILLIVVGTISFFYSNGLKTLQSNWLNIFKPAFSLELICDNTFIPIDGNNQKYIDAIIKNKKGQLLDGQETTATIVKGAIDIAIDPHPPAGVSKRFIASRPLQSGYIILNFNFKGTNQTLTLEAFDPTPPVTPAISAPKTDAIFSTATPIISGQASIGSKVEIYIDDEFNTITETDKSGLFNIALEQAISRGKHKLYIKSLNKYGIHSYPSSPIYINISTPDPKIDLGNIRLRPDLVEAGEVFYIFIPTSADTTAVTIILENINWLLKDKNQSSIFSGAIRAPQTPGLYRLSAIITNSGNDNTLAENIISLTVK